MPKGENHHDPHLDGGHPPIRPPSDARPDGSEREPHARATLIDDVSRTLDLSGRMRRHPYRTLFIAAAGGFIVSGATFSRLWMQMVRAGVATLVLPMLERRFEDAIRRTPTGQKPVHEDSQFTQELS
jgi:hypothetical protein